MNSLVSIITPCYNGKDYISRFLDSILSQSYNNIELIIIDDGSTDNTAKIIESYQDSFLEKNFTLKLIQQKNAGQAAAINSGLKIFKGEYLTWPDSDDFLTPNSIEKRVLYLEKHPEYGFVRSDAAFYLESDLVYPRKLATGDIKNKYREDLFDALILEKDSYVCNGAYLVRTNALTTAIPQRSIYPSRVGQNWQLLIPISFHSKCGYIDLPLYNIVVRKNSHSRSFNNIDSRIKRLENLEDLLTKIVLDQDIDREFYKKLISEKYLQLKFDLVCTVFNSPQLLKYYRKLPNKSIKIKIHLFIARTPIVFHLYQFSKIMTNKVKNLFRRALLKWR